MDARDAPALSRLDAAARRELAREWNAPEEIEAFVGWMKELRAAERKQVEARLRDATPGFVPTAAEREEFDLASWRELRTPRPGARARSARIRSRTPILPGTPPAELEVEVRDSRRQLERGLQRPVDLFAYPNGDLNPEVEACVRRHHRGRRDFVDRLGAARRRHPPPA